MSGFVPADEQDPTLGEIARGLNQIHACVDGFRDTQERVNAAVERERVALTKTVGGLRRDVGHIKRGLEALQDRQDADSGKITLLAQLFGAEKPEPGEKRPKGHGIATWGGWKVVGAIGGSVGLFVFLFQLAVAVAPAAFHYIMGLHP